MKLSHIFSASLLTGLSALLTVSPAQAQSYGFGVNGGTDGMGVHGKAKITRNLQLTLGYSTLDYKRDEDYDGVNYEGDLNISTFYAIGSLHPFASGFNVAGGLYVGDRSVDLLAISTGSVEIGSQTFTPEEIGTLRGQAETKKVAPYAGIGYDNFISASGDWSFNLRLGVIFSGTPDVSLVSSGGTLTGIAEFETEVAAEIARLEDEIKDFKYYPVASIGLTRKF